MVMGVDNKRNIQKDAQNSREKEVFLLKLFFFKMSKKYFWFSFFSVNINYIHYIIGSWKIRNYLKFFFY